MNGSHQASLQLYSRNQWKCLLDIVQAIVILQKNSPKADSQ